MSRRIMMLVLLTGLLILAPPTVRAQGPRLPANADQVCQDLLKMLDQGRLQETYALADPLIKQTQNADQWHGRMLSERESMGQTISRRLVRIETVQNFADLPKGRYLLAVFRTEFSTQPETEEIVVLIKDKDGGFGVAGYQLRYNRWPEAVRIIINGLFIVFFIMSLLASITWLIGRVIQKTEENKSNKEKG